jgi:penicillin-binding protein 2
MPDAPRVRLSVLGVVVVSLFGALFARLWYLQVAAAPRYEATSVTNRLREVQLKPTRGRILDVNGFVLVDNKRALVVTIERDSIKDDDERAMLFNRLSGALQVPVNDLEERYISGVDDPLLPFPISKDVSEATANYLMERREDFPGVEVSETFERVYRYGPTGANIIGYTARINDTNRDYYVDQLDYELSDRVGTAGIERYYEAELRGKPGKIIYEVDARERIVREVAYEPPVPGNDIQLTIDIQVQQLAEQTLEQALIERRQTAPPPDRSAVTGEVTREWGNYLAPSGAVVVEDPNNGSLLALASNPPFDPRWFTEGVSAEKFAELFRPDDKNGPLVDRTTQGGYAPASTFKPFTAYAALKNGYIESPSQTIDDTGKYTIDPKYCAEGAKCTFQNAGGIGTGRVDLQRALTKSSDVYFYRLGDEMMRGKGDLLQDGVREWGYGSRTGVQLPNEYDGLVPDKESRKEACETNPDAFTSCDYFLGDNVQLAIGQGDMLATPLQMANAYSALANGGTVWRPNVVKAVLAPNAPDMPPPPEPVCDEPVDGGDAATDTASPPPTDPPQTGDSTGDTADSVADPCADVPVTTTTTMPLPEIVGPGVTAPPTSASPTASTLEPPPPPPPLRIPQVDLTKATIVRSIDPTPQSTVAMPEEWRVPIINGLMNVPRSGTAASAFQGFDFGDFPIAGKTGTAQDVNQEDNKDTSLFTGFGPLQHEQQYTVTAVLVESGFGAEAAAPVVRRMYEGLLGVTPLPEPYLYEDLDPRQDVAGILPPYDASIPITGATGTD